ncbi:MAG: hypothetical protein ABIN96_15430 [Rubrivivax sp.]
MTDAEIEHLRVRIVALEGLVIGLMADASPRQLRVAERVARHITPRPGFTAHPLTLKAAAEMRSLVRRARAFSSSSKSRGTDGDQA